MMHALAATLIPLASSSDEAMENVKPGWIPLIIVLLLGAFVAFLYFSLRKQLGKIDIPEGGVPTGKQGSEQDDAGGEDASA